MKYSPQSPHLPSADSGNAVLELALSLPLFLILIVGGAEIANLAWASVQVNNAARAGAAFGSISRTNAADITHIQLAAQNEAPRLAITFPSPPTQLCSCVDSGGSPTVITCGPEALTDCPWPSTIQVAVKVNTQATVRPLVHYIGLPATFTVNAQATLGVEQ
jgi:Flp pilus assembly protein TadG